MASNTNHTFGKKETTKDGTGQATSVRPAGSKYFKPGYIFNQVEKKETSADDFGDDLGDDDYEEAISQASQKLSKPCTSSVVAGQPGTMKPEALARMNQIASQSVDFTRQTGNAHIPSLKGSNTILVNSNQRQNPLLQSLRTVRYILNDSIAPAHYLLSDSCCALFLSLKYHVINPDYIYERINELQNKYQLKILLVMVDHIIYETHLKELTLLAVRTNFTLMLAWTYEEAARHIENYRNSAEKSPDVIRGCFEDGTKSTSANQQQSLVDALTSVKSVNRTDAVTLMSTFETFENIIKANMDELTVCPGISMVKARRLHTLFNKPLLNSDSDSL